MNIRIPRSLVIMPGSVLETYPGLGVGNYLYFALRAHAERAQGDRTWVVDSGLDPRWHEAVPRLSPLLMDPKKSRLRRLRHIPSGFHQGFGSDFSRDELTAFVEDVLVPAVPDGAPPSDLVVNVRRGDYYANPEFRQLYGFDQVDYLHTAMEHARSIEPIIDLTVVSDDISWCRLHLNWLMNYAARVRFGARASGPIGDFWEVASARRQVLTNSTFSYWGAYVSQVIHGDRHLGVWAPDFHQRNVQDGRPWQHDPNWHAIGVSIHQD